MNSKLLEALRVNFCRLRMKVWRTASIDFSGKDGRTSFWLQWIQQLASELLMPPNNGHTARSETTSKSRRWTHNSTAHVHSHSNPPLIIIWMPRLWRKICELLPVFLSRTPVPVKEITHNNIFIFIINLFPHSHGTSRAPSRYEHPNLQTTALS
jgi:hypothetical protein